MRSLGLAVPPLLVAASLAAQAPPRSDSVPGPLVAPRRAAFLDVAALTDSRERFGLEPVVLGRVTIGLIGAHRRSSWNPPVPPIAWAGPIPGGPVACVAPGCVYWPTSSSYDSWRLDLAVRWYPAALTFSNPQRRLMIYLGEFIGFERTTADTQRFSGWEPGAEIGARLRPLEPLFLDVGGWFKMVTVDDPTGRLRPGQVDARLVVAVGVGW